MAATLPNVRSRVGRRLASTKQSAKRIQQIATDCGWVQTRIPPMALHTIIGDDTSRFSVSYPRFLLSKDKSAGELQLVNGL